MFGGQFVPLKITTDGNQEWSTWSRKYPVNGRGIPILYVVRADGEKLYGASGSLSGAALPQMLGSVLQKSGRSFNDEEAALLKSSVEAAKKAAESEDFGTAAAELSKLSKLGTLGELNSYAVSAVEADTLSKQVVEALPKMLEQAQSKVDTPDTAFASALELMQIQEQFEGFKSTKFRIATAIKEVRKDKTLAPLFSQAEAIIRARQLAMSDRAVVNRKAPLEYEKVIRRYPGTKADELAREELAAISPNARILTEPSTPMKMVERIWTDRTGKFKLRATLVKVADGKVTLKKEDGQEITLAIEKLSTDDQQIANGQTPQE